MPTSPNRALEVRALGNRRNDLAALRACASAEAVHHGGVLSRDLLRATGIDRHLVRNAVTAGRWALAGRQTVAMQTGPLDQLARRWRAVWEVGEQIAAIDGVSALQAAGLVNFSDSRVHVSVVHTADLRSVEGVEVHKVIRRTPQELAGAGLPRTRPAVAAIRAAHWAASDRQAALILCMTVQQRLCTGAQLREAEADIPGRNRRAFIHQIVGDVADGAHSLGELDVLTALRRRGLPPPTRQSLRQLPGGKVYLDMVWEEARLVVEVDGAGHVSGLQMVDDDLRQNAVAMGDRLVIRIGLIGWRLFREQYLDQVCTAYWPRVRTWTDSPPAA